MNPKLLGILAASAVLGDQPRRRPTDALALAPVVYFGDRPATPAPVRVLTPEQREARRARKAAKKAEARRRNEQRRTAVRFGKRPPLYACVSWYRVIQSYMKTCPCGAKLS